MMAADAELACVYGLAMVFFLAWAKPHVWRLAFRSERRETPEQHIAWLSAQNASLEGRLHLTAEARDRAQAEVEMLAAAHATVSLHNDQLERTVRELREALVLHSGKRVLRA